MGRFLQGSSRYNQRMEGPRTTSWELSGSDGRPIYGETHYPHEGSTTPSGIPMGSFFCCHGFKGYKDYGFLPLLCDRAARSGLIAIRFNFSHSGMTNHIDSFEHPGLFEKDTWSRQVNDLQDLLAVGRLTGFDNIYGIPANSSRPVVLFGHSRGGDTTLMTAARMFDQSFYTHGTREAWPNHPNTQLAALITAAAPDYACNLDDLAKEQLRAEGRLLSPSGRTGQDLYVGREWLDEIERDPELYDPVLAAAHVKCPTLIIHGSGDTTVPVECAHNLHRAATPNSRLAIIDGASHTFDCPNPLPIDTPWAEVPAATRAMIDLTVAFAVEQCEKARGSA